MTRNKRYKKEQEALERWKELFYMDGIYKEDIVKLLGDGSDDPSGYNKNYSQIKKAEEDAMEKYVLDGDAEAYNEALNKIRSTKYP